MPYHYSRARKQLIADLGTTRIALRDAYSAKCSSGVVREFALCGAVALASAKVETYLATLVADWGKAVLAAGLKTDSLHGNTRAFLLNEPGLEKVYKRLAFDGNEGDFILALAQLLGKPLFNFSKDGENIPPFPVARVFGDTKYPSPKNLSRLFKRLGISPVFDRLNALAKRDVESLLTSFNDIGLVVGYIDRLFYSHVCKTVGATCWLA